MTVTFAWAFHSVVREQSANVGVVLRDSKAAVLVSVDDLNPQPGDSVNFTLVVLNLNNNGGSKTLVLLKQHPGRGGAGQAGPQGSNSPLAGRPIPAMGDGYEKTNSSSGTNGRWEMLLNSSLVARIAQARTRGDRGLY